MKKGDHVWVRRDSARGIELDTPPRMGHIIGPDITSRYEWVVSFGPSFDPDGGPQAYDEDDLILVQPLKLGDKIECRFRDNGFVPGEIVGVDTDPAGRDGKIPWRCYTAKLPGKTYEDGAPALLYVHTHGEGLSWKRPETPAWADDGLDRNKYRRR